MCFHSRPNRPTWITLNTYEINWINVWVSDNIHLRSRSTPPNVATGMANNTKKQCHQFDWVYVEEVEMSVGRAWWSYAELTLTWLEVCWTVINWLFLLIRWSMDCYFFNNKHSESISKSVIYFFLFRIHVLKYLKSPDAFLFLFSQSVYYESQ
jgi:hypothetical protein